MDELSVQHELLQRKVVKLGDGNEQEAREEHSKTITGLI
jgi:hypothetical protein